MPLHNSFSVARVVTVPLGFHHFLSLTNEMDSLKALCIIISSLDASSSSSPLVNSLLHFMVCHLPTLQLVQVYGTIQIVWIVAIPIGKCEANLVLTLRGMLTQYLNGPMTLMYKTQISK